MSKTVGSLSSITAEDKKSSNHIRKRSQSEGSLDRSRALIAINGDLAGGSGTLENDLGMSGSERVGGEDLDEQSEEVPRRLAKKTSKKMLFLWSLVTYGIISVLFFITNAGILITMWFRKMRYFIREPDSASLFDVVPDVFWILIRFLFGSLLHILLTTLTVLVLIGVKQMEHMVVTHQEKMLLWLFVLACISEYIMFAGTLAYMSSTATVENGQAKDTLVPHDSNPDHQKCFDLTLVGHTGSKSHVDVNLVRANLKWMVQVSCGTGKEEDGSSIPTWKLILNKVFMPEMQKVKMCSKLKADFISDAISDCKRVSLLDGTVFAWLVLDGLGIWFCIGLFYLYLKSVVRTKPGRFSFMESTYQNDIEALRHVAERVRKFAEHNQNHTHRNVEAVEEGDHQIHQSHRRHSRRHSKMHQDVVASASSGSEHEEERKKTVETAKKKQTAKTPTKIGTR